MKALGLEEFQQYIKTQSEKELNEIGLELQGKIKRARKPDIKLGYAIAIDLVICEIKMREPLPPESGTMTNEELLAALGL